MGLLIYLSDGLLASQNNIQIIIHLSAYPQVISCFWKLYKIIQYTKQFPQYFFFSHILS